VAYRHRHDHQVLTSGASFLAVTSSGMDQLDGMHAVAIFLGAFIGGVTLTGSIVAFGKLSGMMSGKALQVRLGNIHGTFSKHLASSPG
jgi:NAD/NADP transhydrogenase beta subunit